MDFSYGYSRIGRRSFVFRKLFLIVLILAFHCVLYILFGRYSHSVHPESNRSSILYLSPLPKRDHLFEPMLPELNRAKFQSTIIAPPDFSVNAISSEMPLGVQPKVEKTSERYSNVFDPKIRKKFSETVPHNSQPKSEKYKTTYLSDGRMMVEVGDGQCIVSMPKTDSRDRGTTWSTNTIRCGKSDSEKFMDNVQRDLDSRRVKPHD